MFVHVFYKKFIYYRGTKLCLLRLGEIGIIMSNNKNNFNNFTIY
jgi:hypothetical protein